MHCHCHPLCSFVEDFKCRFFADDCHFLAPTQRGGVGCGGGDGRGLGVGVGLGAGVTVGVELAVAAEWELA